MDNPKWKKQWIGKRPFDRQPAREAQRVAVEAGAKGIVVAGVGDGNMTAPAQKRLAELRPDAPEDDRTPSAEVRKAAARYLVYGADRTALLPLLSGVLVSGLGFAPVFLAASVAAAIAVRPLRRIDCGDWYRTP